MDPRDEVPSAKNHTIPVLQNERYTVLMIEAPPSLETDKQELYREGIVEDVTDEDEEQRTIRAKKGKFVMSYETEPIIEFPGDASLEGMGPKQSEGEVISIREVGESSGTKGVGCDLDPRFPEADKKMGPAEDTVSILVDTSDSSKVLQIGARLHADLRARLVAFLKDNLDVFAWSHVDMVGINLEVMCHHLNIDPIRKGVR